MSNPTAEQLRQARHLGAKAALAHLPEQRRADLLVVHTALDTRREKNISSFCSKARGDKPG